MKQDDYYSLLGVSRFAGPDVIKRAYRSRVLSLHPDLNPSDVTAGERMREVIQAYRVLSTPSARRDYDASLVPYTPPMADAPRQRGYSLFVSRLVVALFLIVVVAGLGFFIEEAVSDRPPVFRPDLSYFDFSSVPVNVVAVHIPDITNCVEWYCAQEYELTFGNERAAWYMERAYSRAADFAEARGRHDTARFYKTSIQEVRNSLPTAIL